MDQATANALFEQCALLLFLDAPQNLEFGIDFNTWKTGPRFKGLKLIPPGLHFVYYSALSKFEQSGVRTGFFKYFEPREIVIKQWNPKEEDIFSDSHLDSDQLERYQFSDIRDFDPSLGVYPLVPTPEHPVHTYGKWLHLTTHISSRILDRVIPSQDHKISSMTSVSRFSDLDAAVMREKGVKGETGGAGAVEGDDKTREAVSKKQEGGVEGEQQLTVGTDTTPTSSPNGALEELRLHFTHVDLKRSFPDGASASDITKYSLDKSFLLEKLLKSDYRDYKDLLGELELSFIVFLIGQVYDGLEQWKTLVQLVCQSDEAIDRYGGTLFVEFVDTLRLQIQECPDDFFNGELTTNNFLRASLVTFVRNLRERGGRGVPHALQKSVDGLLDHLRDRFKWDLRHDVRMLGEEEEEDEYAPILVEM
ncbi:a1-alpha2 repression [Borealophlyctis nickersoniae]|nr:a1-alpha2 repression [Borealophlyctis nickersoniae]